MAAGAVDVIQQQVCRHFVIGIVPLHVALGEQFCGKRVGSPGSQRIGCDRAVAEIESITSIFQVQVEIVGDFQFIGNSQSA